MRFKTLFGVTVSALLATSAGISADLPNRVSIQVVDEHGEAVHDADVKARYLETVVQDGKQYPVPMKLAQPQSTDTNGRCELTLNNVSWTLAGLYAHRVELTTEEAMELSDDAPNDEKEREAFDRDLQDRCQRFRSAYRILPANTENGALITLELAKAIKVTGRVRVNGKPLSNAFVTVYSGKTSIDQLFARSAPELTDRDGRFSFYSVPGDLDRAKIVVERPTSHHVLTLTDVQPEKTPTELVFNFDTEAKDYVRVDKP